MAHSPVRHIVRQGIYSSSDIVVLTPSTGQLQKLRAEMRSDFETVLSDRDQDVLGKDGFNDEEPVLGIEETSTHSLGIRKEAPGEEKKLTELTTSW